MGELGTGVFEIAQEPVMGARTPDERADFFRRMQDLAVDTGVPITFGVISAARDGSDWPRQLELIDSTARAGGQMFAQAHSREFAVVLSWKTRLPFDKLPLWRELRAQPLADQKRDLQDQSLQARLVEAARDGDYGRAIGAETRRPDYDWIRILERPVPPNPTVAQRAAETGRDPVQVMIDLALATDFDQLFTQVIANRDPDSLLSIMRHPRALVTFSDSGAHVSQIMDSSLQTHLLAHWVRDQEAFTLEEAVRNLTLAPATAWHFADRGLVREGFVADLNVIDPERVAPTMPEVVSDLPGGAKRLVQTSTGIRSTIVAGEEILVDGKPTGALPGVVLRGRLAS